MYGSRVGLCSPVCERHLLVTGDTNNTPEVRITPLEIPPFGYSAGHLFQNYLNTGHRFNITFIFVRCHCSLAVVTPDIFRHDLENITDTFAKGKNNNQSFSIRHYCAFFVHSMHCAVLLMMIISRL